MNAIYVKSFSDLIGKHNAADIINLLGGDVVRRMQIVDNTVKIDPGGGHEVVTVPLSQPIMFNPWFMDRGNLLFRCPGYEYAKICTEADIIRYPDGTQYRIMPASDAEWIEDL